MNYITKILIRDGAMSQLKNLYKLYKDEYITAEECIKESNGVLYSFLSALDESNVDYDCIIAQHRANFNRYKDWVNEKLEENER